MLQAVINHLWQSTLFTIGIALLCFILRDDSARIRYSLWLTASVKFLVPFSALTSLGARFSGASTTLDIPAVLTVTAEKVSQPFAAFSLSWALGTILLTLWIVGSIAVLGRWLIGVIRLQTVLREAEFDPRPVRNGSEWVSVYRTKDGIEPGVVGLFRPVMLLPKDIENHLTPGQHDAIVAHELCHIRRRDNLTAAAHMLVEAGFWFFPPVWWIGARLIEERERACDEHVVRLGHDRETYAEGILNVCEHFSMTRIACAAGVSGGALSRRVTQILRSKTMIRLRYPKKVLLTLAASATISAPVVFGLAVQNTATAQDRGSGTQPQGTDFGVDRTLRGQAVNPDGVAEARPAQRGGDTDAIAAETRPYLPIVKVAPVYPPRAALRGIEGYVILEYTVATTGTPRDIRVVESSTVLFEQSAIDSARKYKYEPKVVNGIAVEVPGVRTMIRYQLSASDADRARTTEVVVTPPDEG